LCQLGNWHTSTTAHLSISKIPIMVMNPIVIPTGVALTQSKMFGDLFERMSGIFFLVKINHPTPECSKQSETNALLRMNLNGSHLVFVLNETNINQIWGALGQRCATTTIGTSLYPDTKKPSYF